MTLLGLACVALATANVAGLLLGQVEHRLNAAAEVHQAKGDVVDVAAEDVGREVILEGEEGHRWEIIEHDDAEDDQDHLECSLLHRVHLVPAGPWLPQHPQDGDVAEHHEGERRQDHSREDLLKVDDVAHALCGGVAQRNQPHAEGQHGPVPAVLELGEGERVHNSHIAVEADAGQEERRGVLDAVEEAQHIPGAAGSEEDDVGQLQRRDEAEEHVQDGQVQDKDVWGRRVAFVFVDEPEHHEVGRDAQEHVDELEAQVPDDNSRHVSAELVHRPLHCGVIEGPLGDEEGRRVQTEEVHDVAD